MKQTVTVVYCDWHDDGETEAASPPIRWKEGTTTYELDLCRDCKAEHRAGARRIKAKPRVPVETNGHARTTSARRKRRKGPQPAEIRTWARQEGHDVRNNGRVPQAVVDAYEAATAN